MTRAPLARQAEVSIVGMGVQTVVGRTAPQAAAAVRARIARLAEHPYLIDLEYEPMRVAQAPWLGDETDCAERMRLLAEPALREALTPLRILHVPRPQLKLLALLGLPTPRPGLPANRHSWLVRQLSEALSPEAGTLSVEGVPADHASALKALELGCEQLIGRQVDACLVGGVDSFLCAETLNWLEAEGRLLTSRNPRGAIPGEAAAFCLLMKSSECGRLGVSPLAGVRSVATAQEPVPPDRHSVCTGEGLSQAFQGALAELPPETRVDHVLCDLNGETHRADEFAFALARTSARFVRPGAFRSPVDCWGDVGAASGALLLVLAASAWQRRYAPGPLTLASASSGHNPLRAAALLQAPPSVREDLSCP